MAQECPVCETLRTQFKRLPSEDRDQFDCARCGVFQLQGGAARFKRLLDSSKKRMLFSHIIRRAQRRSAPPNYGDLQVEQLLQTQSLPTLQEQIENLILFVGDRQEFISKPVDAPSDEVEASIGCYTNLVSGRSDLAMVIESIKEEGKFLHNPVPPEAGLISLCLSLQGWRRYEDLKRAGSKSNRVFMAMSFGNTQLRTFVDKFLRDAVRAAGLELFVLSDAEPAGLIDERMRVEIRNSRMLIADLTDKNNGAYFEAGFAEGLGRPVLYICEASAFEKERHVHFDTSHHQVVTWSLAEAQKAADRVKWSIRNTLPGEAKMVDE